MATVHREPNQVKWVGVRPGHNGEQILVKIELAGNAIVYTVPANKILFLFDWHIGIARGVAGAAELQIRDDAAAIHAYLSYVTSAAGYTGTNATQNLWVPHELIEAWDIYVVTGNPVRGYIHGILIDA